MVTTAMETLAQRDARVNSQPQEHGRLLADLSEKIVPTSTFDISRQQASNERYQSDMEKLKGKKVSIATRQEDPNRDKSILGSGTGQTRMATATPIEITISNRHPSLSDPRNNCRDL